MRAQPYHSGLSHSPEEKFQRTYYSEIVGYPTEKVTMSLSLRLEVRKTYLYAMVDGVFTLPEADRLFVRILDSCLEQGQSKVLVDYRSIRGSPPTTDVFLYGKFIALAYSSFAVKGLPPVKFAYVGNPPFASPHGVAEAAAVSRALDLFVTTDFDEALEWLGIAAPKAAK
ncbi:protein of unknown function [Georgfuchsia toluolica]|uniref:STAS/SEC14 domain-containing protein n=2 Tax=Georgfuchsia toluolica TaxID=424218 RepID=A0A916N099_9PROT|nr:protein of unknown function [Georgfuchsia toluolica]